MGRGLVKAPLDESVPALRVLLSPLAGSLKNRDIGSTSPGGVASNLRFEISV
jgi:hypothetical protein